MKKAFLSSLLVLGLAIPALPAAAQNGDSGFYAGGSLGQAKVIDACAGLPAGFSCKDHDTTYKVFGGYQANKNFGFELGYADFGKVKASGTVLGLPIDASVKSHAYDLTGVVTIPVAGPFSVLGKFGLYYGEVKSHGTAGSSSADLKGDNIAPTWGFGAKYDISRNFAARAEYQNYYKVGNTDTGEDTVYTLTVGVQYQFR